MKPERVLVERVVNAPSKRVWKAITDIKELKQWAMPFPDFKAEVGFEFRFEIGPPGGKQYLHVCKVLEVIKERKLAFAWRYDGYAGDSVVTYRLTPMGEKTLVQITHEGIETFPAEFLRDDFKKGWTFTIEALEKFTTEKAAV
jgi:uncharacterized protein YndB with AHSA1/START domain